MIKLHSIWVMIVYPLAIVSVAVSAMAQDIRFATQDSIQSLDPYSLNETFTLGTLSHVYEGLIRRGPNMEILPALAESWEALEPTRWRFYLRKGVKFHNGNSFTAADVAFSADRVRSKGSDLKDSVPADARFEIIDDHTLDVVLSSPNPILHYGWDTWGIVDKEWTEATDSVHVSPPSDWSQTAISLEANGTGPFKIVYHEASVRTGFEVNRDWWDFDASRFDVEKVEFVTIQSSATRVTAFLSGEVDFIYPVPAQYIERINRNPSTIASVQTGLRTIFIGMDQTRNELLYSNVKGRNPFKDQRIREAIYKAIDIDTIQSKVMGNLSTPSSIMISPFIFENANDFRRLTFDPDGARRLLEEAGYPNGFEIGMDCPNDRYVNDEAICQMIAHMLAHVGVKVNLNIQPKSQFFSKVLASGGFDTSFYLLGWLPGSFDSWNVFSNLHGCRDGAGKGGMFNLGGYCNGTVDSLTAQILVENNPEKRLDLITQVHKITTGQIAYIPLHQQDLVSGVKRGVNMSLRADGSVLICPNCGVNSPETCSRSACPENQVCCNGVCKKSCK